VALALAGVACGGGWYQRFGIQDEKELYSYRALPKLERALEKGSCFDLMHTGEALARIGARAYTIQESMQRGLLRAECRTTQREPMARALGLLGGRAFDFLAKQLASPELEVRALGVVGLAHLQAEPARVIPVLRSTAALPAENVVWSLGIPDPRLSAIEGLGRFGARAEPALPELLSALREDRLAAAAARALAAVGLPRPEVIAALRAHALQLTDEEEKRRVVADLERLAPGSAADIPLPPPPPAKKR